MKVGDIVKDKYSPFQGVIVMQIVQFSGVKRFSVQGVKDNEPSTYEFDDIQLEVLHSAPEDLTPKPSGKVQLGDKVREIASGWEGVVTAFYLYLNGCVRIEITGPKNKKEKTPTLVAVDEVQVEPLGPSLISALLKRPAKVEPQGPPRTGGARGTAPVGR